MSEIPKAWKLGDLVEDAESHFALDNFRKCHTCRFWDEVDVGAPLGDCRWQSPAVSTPRYAHTKGGHGAYEDKDLDNFAIEHVALWPQTRYSDWCGEWEKRPWLKAPPEACDT